MLESVVRAEPFRGELARLVHSMGGQNFELAFLKTLNELFRVDLQTALIFNHSENLVGIMGASRHREDLAASLSRRFYEKHWRGDLNVLGLRNFKSGIGRRFWRMPWTQVPSEQMRQELYRAVDIREKMSVCSNVPGGFVIWNAYRQNEFFSQDEFDCLKKWADVLSAVIAKHLSTAQAPLPSAKTDMKSKLCSFAIERGTRLSARELSVCEGIVKGETSKEIAASLDIKTATVITYKRRIYEKLGISLQRELLACLLSDSVSSPEHS
jgi:DNA-binding CsgD family transcriptional regulator